MPPLSGWPARAPTPRLLRTTSWSRCSSRRAASWCRSCGARGRTPSACASSRTRRSTACPRSPATPPRPPALGSDLIDLLKHADDEARGMGDEYVSTEHLLLALAGSPKVDTGASRDQLAQAVQRGARAAPRDRPEPGGALPGARALRPRPHRGRPAGQARPGDRPRRGGPARDPGAVAAHQEQPGPDRRAGRGQDRHRRGARPADRVRRRAGVAPRQARDRARHRRPDRRLQVPGRVRGPAEGRAQGDRRRPGPGDPVHGRAAHDRRGRRGRGRRGRGQPAQADARARRAARGRRHHPRRVPQAHREGRRARAALPAGDRGRALRGGHDRDPARTQGALRGAPRRAHPGRGDHRGGHALPALHRGPLPTGQGDRPDRRGGLRAAHRDRLDAHRDRHGGAADPAARDRAPGAQEGKGRGLGGAPRGDRARAGRPARALQRDEGPLAGREGGHRGHPRREGAARAGAPRGRARRARRRPSAGRRAALRGDCPSWSSS